MSVYGSINFSPALYKTKKCAQCGKVFECPVNTRYKIMRKNRPKYFCSYSCFRVVDKALRERAHAAVARQSDQYRHAQELRLYREKLEESLEAAQPRWISVEERLPEVSFQTNRQEYTDSVFAVEDVGDLCEG